MLKWIASRLKPTEDAPGHPLGSEADIAQWLGELPAVNPQRVLIAIDEWLEDPEHLAQQLSPGQMARAVSRLDEYAATAAAQCWEEIWTEGMKERRTVLPTRPLETYYGNSYRSNRYVMQLLAGDPELGQDKRQVARFAARAMHAWVQLKKLARMIYRAPADDWWSQAHSLNRQSRELAVSHLAQSLYSHSTNPASVWSEYMAGVLLETLPLSNLTSNEIEVADRLGTWITPRASYQDTQSTLTLFQIDPDGARGPERCLKGQSSSATLRYLGPGAGYQQLIQLRGSLTISGKVPPWLASAGLSVEQLKDLLHTLTTHWSPNPPSRAQPRRASTGKIRVVNGLPLVRRMIAASEFARSGRSLDYEGYIKSMQLRHKGHAVIEDMPPPPKTPMEVLQLLETAGDRQMMEQWEIIDESAQGMGVRCITRRPWHAIGALIAYRREQDLDWRVGIVRRLGSSHGAPNAGLIVFGGTPACSQVRVGNAREEESLWHLQTKETSGLGWRDAILLSTEQKLLLVPPGTFAVDQRIDISVGGRFRPARLAGLQGKGNDYELVLYREAEAMPDAPPAATPSVPNSASWRLEE